MANQYTAPGMDVDNEERHWLMLGMEHISKFWMLFTQVCYEPKIELKISLLVKKYLKISISSLYNKLLMNGAR